MPRLVINVDDETLQALIELAVEAGMSTEEAAEVILRDELVEGQDQEQGADGEDAPGMVPQVS